jgi:hypothetical protein
MTSFTESNITLNFPDSNFFRFADCTGYRQLSGNSFKEMDACWYDTNHNVYWLIELKDFTQATLGSKENVDSRVLNMLRKAVDSLCMFLSSKHEYAYATNLNPCFPYAIPNSATQFKFMTIVHCKDSQRADIQALNEQFRRRFSPYAKLFGITDYAVLEHSQAMRLIPNSMVK